LAILTEFAAFLTEEFADLVGFFVQGDRANDQQQPDREAKVEAGKEKSGRQSAGTTAHLTASDKVEGAQDGGKQEAEEDRRDAHRTDTGHEEENGEEDHEGPKWEGERPGVGRDGFEGMEGVVSLRSLAILTIIKIETVHTLVADALDPLLAPITESWVNDLFLALLSGLRLLPRLLPGFLLNFGLRFLLDLGLGFLLDLGLLLGEFKSQLQDGFVTRDNESFANFLIGIHHDFVSVFIDVSQGVVAAGGVDS
jgi:hypothetical protein